MADHTAPTPPQHSRFKGFLPLSDDAVLSTRGKSLPGLLQQSLSGRSHPNRPPSARSEELCTDGAHSPARKTAGSAAAVCYLDDRRSSIGGASVLLTPQMRSQRLIGNSNPRYKWEQYWKSDDELKTYPKKIRQYYEHVNLLVQQYAFIDRLLDSSLPHNLIQEYGGVSIPDTISEEAGSTPHSPSPAGRRSPDDSSNSSTPDVFASRKVKRTPKNLYKVPDGETLPLLAGQQTGYGGTGDDDDLEAANPSPMPIYEPEEETDSQHRIVTIAIYANLIANTVLLAMKVVVTVMTSSLSVLASLVDAALDFLSTAIVWVTTRLISRQDRYSYPIGRSKLEPVGVLIFSVIMITAFFQVLLEGAQRFLGTDRSIVRLTTPALVIMLATVVIKGLCWFWCRMIKNSSVQALAQDAMTDVVFNFFSIVFPLAGYYTNVWWMDPLGGVVLSLWVIVNWSQTSTNHIKNLTGRAASADERNILLYLSMRFAKTIKQIQGLQAYHSGDKLIVEVDIVVDENINIRDAHDLGESLQYVLESVPSVDRAFVHLDYASWNLPTHMQQHD